MKKFATAVLALALLLLTGCSSGERTPAPTITPMTAKPFTDRAAVSALYDQVRIDDRLEDLEAKFGKGVEHDAGDGNVYVEFIKDGAGVAVALRMDDTVMGKVVYHEDIRQFATLTPKADVTIGALIEKGTELKYVEAVVGDKGVEIATTASEDVAGKVTVTRLIVWADESAAQLRVTIDAEDKVVDVQTVIITPPMEDAA